MWSWYLILLVLYFLPVGNCYANTVSQRFVILPLLYSKKPHELVWDPFFLYQWSICLYQLFLISGGKASTSFFLFRIFRAILELFIFDLTFRINFSSSMKNTIRTTLLILFFSPHLADPYLFFSGLLYLSILDRDVSNFLIMIIFFVILCNSVSFSLIYFEVAVRCIIANLIVPLFYHVFFMTFHAFLRKF